MTIFRSLIFIAMLTATSVCLSHAANAQWSAVVSPAGNVRVDLQGVEVGSLVPGLHDSAWKAALMSDGKITDISSGNSHRGKITAADGTVVDVTMNVDQSGEAVKFNYQLTPRASIRLNSLHVNLSLPTGEWAGGSYAADQAIGALPSAFKEVALKVAPMRSLRLTRPSGESVQFAFDSATSVLIQDDRQWGQTFSVRLGRQDNNGDAWPAGKSMTVAFSMTGSGGMKVVNDQPVTIQAGKDWLPLDVTLDIEPGSALDFSDVIPRHSPAGKFGRVIVNPEGKFAFANEPQKAVRFYGINLCFSAQYLQHEVADQLADRLYRLGYNALRIHHYEGELVDRSNPNQLRFKPDKLDQLDYLLAAMKRRGIYVTTDLFVSRPVSKALLYPGESGDIGMDEFKMAVHVNERAYNDFANFSRMLLDHVNPYTKLRYADDPMLAWLSLVNENCPGNFVSQFEGPLGDDWKRAWNRWLAQKYPDRKSLTAAMGDLPSDQDPLKGSVPMQNVYANNLAATQFNVFLAEKELEFFERTRNFLREELRCDALLSDLSAWTNPVQLQAVRNEFDYVDDHFYVDHPNFLEKPWQLPSSCPNTSPIAEGARGGRNCAFTRLYGKPFTITEFNYSSPGRFRGVGGILTGALGAIQDWDGVWRFSYAHNRDSVSKPGPLNYFDVAADPLNQAAERASLCLFLRGDIEPADHAISINATEAQLLKSPTTSRDKTPSWSGMAWLTKVGWTIGSEDSAESKSRLSLPMGSKSNDPFQTGAEESILSELRSRKWLPADNETDFKKNRFQSDNGDVTIDAPNNTLILDTKRTAGGFAPAGKVIQTEGASIQILDTDATVWISSLDENAIPQSNRLLITHLTDLQNTGARYGDSGRKVLLDWGRLPHLVQNGRAVVTLAHTNAANAKVYALSTSGKRMAEVPANVQSGKLVIPISVASEGKARMLYEVVVSN